MIKLYLSGDTRVFTFALFNFNNLFNLYEL